MLRCGHDPHLVGLLGHLLDRLKQSVADGHAWETFLSCRPPKPANEIHASSGIVLLVAESTPVSYNLKKFVCSRELTRAAVSESHLSSPGLLCRRAHNQRSGKRTGRDDSRDVAIKSRFCCDSLFS